MADFDLDLDHTQENIFTGQQPTRSVVGCVDNDAFNGRYRKTLTTLNITTFVSWMYIFGWAATLEDSNRTQFRCKPLHYSLCKPVCWDWEIDERRGNWHSNRRLCIWIRALRVWFNCRSSQRRSFQLDETRERSSGFKVWNRSTQHDNVIAYAEFESVLEIDKSRNIIIDYKNWKDERDNYYLSGRCRGQFMGVFSSDTLPTSMKKRPAIIVCNTDHSDRGGEH